VLYPTGPATPRTRATPTATTSRYGSGETRITGAVRKGLVPTRSCPGLGVRGLTQPAVVGGWRARDGSGATDPEAREDRPRARTPARTGGARARAARRGQRRRGAALRKDKPAAARGRLERGRARRRRHQARPGRRRQGQQPGSRRQVKASRARPARPSSSCPTASIQRGRAAVLHGMGNLGYRERLADDAAPGQRARREADRWSGEQRMQTQRCRRARTARSSPTPGVRERGPGKAAAKLSLPQITSARIIVSATRRTTGRRRGQRAATAPAPTTSGSQPPLFLFDSINGPFECDAIGDRGQGLDADLVRLKLSRDGRAQPARDQLRNSSNSTSARRPTWVACHRVPAASTRTARRRPSRSPSRSGREVAEGPHRRRFAKHKAEPGPCGAVAGAVRRSGPGVSGSQRATVGTARWRPTRRSATPLRPD
jgi:hypothetical protein